MYNMSQWRIWWQNALIILAASSIALNSDNSNVDKLKFIGTLQGQS